MSRLLHHHLGDERYPFSLPDNPNPNPGCTRPNLCPQRARKEQMSRIYGTSCVKLIMSSKSVQTSGKHPSTPTLANGAQASCIHT